jgi:dATP pyrophosphohydrolase
MPYKQPISALIIIHTPALEVLLLERADFPGYWQSVTGSRDDDETLRETAVRELFEETGLEASRYALTDWQVQNVYDIYPQWLHRYPPGTTRNTEHVFGLELPAPTTVQLSQREHVGQIWLPWQEAADKVFSPSNREAILQLPARAGMDALLPEPGVRGSGLVS